MGDWQVVHPRYVGIPSRVTATGRGKTLEIWSYRRALRGVLADGEQILHAHSCATAGYSLLARRGSSPLVVTVHDNDLQTTVRHPRLRKYVVDTLAGADHVVYQSVKLQGLGEGLVGSHACSVIPWGVNTYDEILGRTPEIFTVISVARLVPTKGLDLLVRAFHRLLRQVPTATLEIVGDGQQRPELERLIDELGIARSTRLTGWLPNREARERVAAATAFVLPSYVESLGIAYLEAMSLGVPAVGVAGQGISDVIESGRNGFLVPPRDEDAVLRVLLELAEDQARARSVGLAGLETFVRGGYDWRGHAEKHALLYRGLL